MILTLILAVSVLLQLLAAALALRLIRVTGVRSVWLLIAAAVALMSVRRIITLFRVLSGEVGPPADPLAEVVALVISILMLAGIARISPLFQAVQRGAEALRRSESQHRAIMEQASEGIFITDQGGRFLAVNRRACETTGYAEGELLQLGLSDLADPEDLEDNPIRFAELRAGKLVVNTRRLRRKDGSLITVELSKRMLTDGRLLGFARDVTLRAQAEMEQRARAEQQDVVIQLTSRALRGEDLQQLFQEAVECIASTLHLPVCGLFHAGAKEEALRLTAGFGWSRAQAGEALLPAPPGSVAAGALRREGAVILEDLRPGPGHDPPDLFREERAAAGLLVAVPGRERPFGLLCALARDPRRFSGEDGRFVQAVAHVLATAVERKGWEDALAQREAHFRTLIENAQDVITILDSEARFLYQSPAILRVLGYAPGELQGQPALDYIHPDDHAAVTTALRRGLENPGRVESAQFRIRHQDGTWRIFEAVGTCTAGPGEPPRMVINSRDITQRRRTEKALRESEEQLRQSQKMEAVGRLAGGIAHDFNNLLTAILGYGELLLGRLEPGDPTHRTVAEIQKAAERAASLTGQLLSFSRRHVHQARALDLNTAVRDTHSLLRRLIGEHIDLQLSLGGGLPALAADPAQLQQILMNLVVNASDALPRGGRIVIETATHQPGSEDQGPAIELPRKEYLRLSVVDDGIGMDSHTLRRALEPFFTTKKEGLGTGLGLSTVYGIVRQSGGDLRITSAPGKGTRVDIYMPATRAAASPPERPAEPAQPRSGHETILLVEDDDAVRELGRTVLETHGYTVLTAQDGREALAIAERRGAEIDLVLTDVVMPGMSGRELASRLAQHHPRLAVLYMSGYTDGALSGRELLDANTLFLAKPFTARDLTDRVRALLDRRTVA